MRLSNDLREFFESLNSRGVDYIIVGAHSLAFHGQPRYPANERAYRAISSAETCARSIVTSRNIASSMMGPATVAANRGGITLAPA